MLVFFVFMIFIANATYGWLPQGILWFGLGMAVILQIIKGYAQSKQNDIYYDFKKRRK